MVDYNYLYDKDFYRDFTDINNKVDKELSYRKFKNSYILPDKLINGEHKLGMMNENLDYIEGSGVHNFCTWGGGGYEIDVSEVKYCDECVIYLGAFYDVWGHCLTDNIKRLWFLKTDIYREWFSHYKLVYVSVNNFEFHINFQRLLNIMGFDKDLFIPVQDISQFSEIIYPDESFFNDEMGNRYFTKEYQELIDEVRQFARDHKKEIGYNKIYFTCSKYSSNKQFGEYRLEDFFEKIGYKIIAPEEHTLDEQLNMLQNCKCFAATIGSASHNIIFLNKDTSVILIPRSSYLTGYQIALNKLQDWDITFVDASLSITAKTTGGPFYYFISDKLLEYFNFVIEKDTKYWRYNSKGFKRYLLLGMIQNYYEDETFSTYYSVEFQKFICGCIRLDYSYKVIKRLKELKIKAKYLLATIGKVTENNKIRTNIRGGGGELNLIIRANCTSVDIVGYSDIGTSDNIGRDYLMPIIFKFYCAFRIGDHKL